MTTDPMPNLDTVLSVTMVDTKIYVLGTNSVPTMLILDVDVLDQARVTGTDWSRAKLTKSKGMSPAEMEIMRIKQESARSAELQQWSTTNGKNCSMGLHGKKKCLTRRSSMLRIRLKKSNTI